MSALIAKREELSKKMNDLLAKREDEINAKVEAYRMSVEASTPFSNEIQNIKNVIAALDEVIRYDAAVPVVAPIIEPSMTKAPVEAITIVEPTIVEPILEVKDAETIATYNNIPADVVIESRPGMSEIITPERG